MAAVAGFSGSPLVNSLNANTAAISEASTVMWLQSVHTDSAKGGHIGKNGAKEVLLSGESDAKARVAALAAVPGGTILRVESDAEGSVYKAHMKNPVGTPVTVKMDAHFKVIGIEQQLGQSGYR